MVILIFICVIAYVCVILFVLKGKNNANDIVTTIIAPSQEEIQQEKELLQKESSHRIEYPDNEFEIICKLILHDDPNPRKVVKLMNESFSDDERKTLLLCLNINNPVLYNEVVALQNCDSSHFETYTSENIDISIENENLIEDSTEFSGIPSSFFFQALEFSPFSDNDNIATVVTNISNVFYSLSPEKQKIIIDKSDKIRKRGRKNNDQLEPVTKTDESDELFLRKIIEEGEKAGEKFMNIYNEYNIQTMLSNVQ